MISSGHRILRRSLRQIGGPIVQIRRTEEKSSLFLRGPLARATRAAAPMQIIEGLTDAEIAEAHRSADIFAEVAADRPRAFLLFQLRPRSEQARVV